LILGACSLLDLVFNSPNIDFIAIADETFFSMV
jgi:hypothetical protein